MPKRIQRKRLKGWRTPTCGCGCGGPARYVGRGSKWGNPWRVEDGMSAKGCVWRYRDALNGELPFARVPGIDEARAELSGHDLACWWALDQPCHADVLLELANEQETTK